MNSKYECNKCIDIWNRNKQRNKRKHDKKQKEIWLNEMTYKIECALLKGDLDENNNDDYNDIDDSDNIEKC